MSVELPLPLPASVFAHSFSATMDDEQFYILDAGSSEGRNARFFSQLGHRVVALDIVHTDLLTSQSTIVQNNPLYVANLGHVEGSIRQLPFPSLVFDAVFSSEVLHQMTKLQARTALKELRRVTKLGGVHAISGYVVNPREANVKNRERCFHPNELLNLYTDAGWQIQNYEEDPSRVRMFGQQQIVDSLARMIAVKK